MQHKGRKRGSQQPLGRSIIKDRSRGRRRGDGGAGGWLHSADLGDGYEWGRLNLRSVTEESHLDAFLRTAELAGTEFTAERLNIRVVDPAAPSGLPSAKEREEMEAEQEKHLSLLSIPRRPLWDAGTTAEQLEERERESFLDWRRRLARLQENDKLVMTPFERNLEFWRQLWRVIERSNVVVQIVDARNPLLFRCKDLEAYVREVGQRGVGPAKVNLVLMNKADLLTQKQREVWVEYFAKHASDITVAFWSAVAEAERLKSLAEEEEEGGKDSDHHLEESATEMVEKEEQEVEEEEEEEEEEEKKKEEKEEEEDEEEEEEDQGQIELADGLPDPGPTGSIQKDSFQVPRPLAPLDTPPAGCEDATMEVESACPEGSVAQPLSLSSARLLTREELLNLFQRLSPVTGGSLTTVGLVGYPNVGKSTSINTLLLQKKVPVSATPGRTKHFQTLYVNEELMLCDCPGLVFPSFVSTKAEMVCSGILPIDQMRDHLPPSALLCQRIPRSVLERSYGIQIPRPGEGEDPGRSPHAHELLNAYGYMRGFMTAHGQPDCPRTARYIIKDYVSGKLLYCHPPPSVDARAFNGFPLEEGLCTPGSQASITESAKAQPPPASQFDDSYFKQERVRVISKGVHGGRGFVRRDGYAGHAHTVAESRQEPPDTDTASVATVTSATSEEKPWKKHHNRNKKQKIRRVT